MRDIRCNNKRSVSSPSFQPDAIYSPNPDLHSGKTQGTKMCARTRKTLFAAFLELYARNAEYEKFFLSATISSSMLQGKWSRTDFTVWTSALTSLVVFACSRKENTRDSAFPSCVNGVKAQRLETFSMDLTEWVGAVVNSISLSSHAHTHWISFFPREELKRRKHGECVLSPNTHLRVFVFPQLHTLFILMLSHTFWNPKLLDNRVCTCRFFTGD